MKTNICITTLLFASITLFGQPLSIKKFDSLFLPMPNNAKFIAETKVLFGKYADLGEDFITEYDTSRRGSVDEEQETWFKRDTPLIGKADKFNNTKFRILAFELNKTMKKGLQLQQPRW